MYKILTVRDKIRVPPMKFNLPMEKAVIESLAEEWEGTIDKDLGVILSVVSVEEVGEGKVFPGNGAIHYPVKFKLLIYYPEMHELVKGNVIDVTEFGVFVRIGPLDGMIHVSQLMNDFVFFDPKNSVFSGRESKRVIKEGDIVRARVISISLGAKQYKIGLTTRQSGLGVLSWIEKEKQDAKKKSRSASKEEKPAKKSK